MTTRSLRVPSRSVRIVSLCRLEPLKRSRSAGPPEITLHPVSVASHWIVTGFLTSKKRSTGAAVTAFFIASTAVVCELVHLNSTSLSSSLRNGSVMSESRGMYFDR